MGYLSESPLLNPALNRVALGNLLTPVLRHVGSVASDQSDGVSLLHYCEDSAGPYRTIRDSHVGILEKPVNLLNQLPFRVCPNRPNQLALVVCTVCSREEGTGGKYTEKEDGYIHIRYFVQLSICDWRFVCLQIREPPVAYLTAAEPTPERGLVNPVMSAPGARLSCRYPATQAEAFLSPIRVSA